MPQDGLVFPPPQGIGGGGVSATSIHKRGTFANRPAAATEGVLYHATDIDVVFRDTGSAWQIWQDSEYGYSFFSDLGLVPATVVKSFLRGTPDAFDATQKPAGMTITATPGGWNWDWGATSGTARGGFNFSADKAEVLVIAAINPGENAAGHSLWVRTTAFADGNTEDDAYSMNPQGGGVEIVLYKVTAGPAYTALVTPEGTYTGTQENMDSIMMALYFKDSARSIRGFMKKRSSQWIEIHNSANADLGDIRSVGVLFGGGDANSYGRLHLPFLIFST